MIDGQRRRDPAQHSEEQSQWARLQTTPSERALSGERARAGGRPYLQLHEMQDESGSYHGIGDLLRAERLRRGEDLDEVAARLRLRPEQLRAIEDGAYDALPGTTYAIGFVRSYAGYLGLDAQEAVERFKRETQGAPAPAALAFPEPSREARVPRGWMLLLAIGIVGVLYAGWYYGSAEQVDLGQDRPPEPGEVAPLPGTAPGADDGAEGKAVTEADSRAAPEARPTEARPPAAMENTATPGGSPIEAPSGALSDASPVAIPTAPAPTASGEAMAGAQSALADNSAVSAPPANDSSASDARVSSWDGPGAAAAGNALATQSSAAAPTGDVPALLLRAHGETWVQVEGSDGDILLSRILRAGDEYAVPDQAGLSLTTGNAGALEILVAGQSTGVVGGLGKVRRDISLDEMRPH